MDIKAEIDKLVSKLTSDKDLASKFAKDPIKTVEGVIGVDLPDDQIKAVVEGVKAKITGGAVADKVEGVVDSLKKMF